MRMTGGVVSIIGSSLGLITAYITLAVASFGLYALEQDPAELHLEEEMLSKVERMGLQQGSSSMYIHGWVGLACSSLVLVLGIVALKSQSSIPGILVLVCCAGGAFFGGIGIAFCLAMAGLGGILSLFPRRVVGV